MIDAPRLACIAQTTITDAPGVGGFDESPQLGVAESLLGVVSLCLIACFIASFISWVRLCRARRTPFGSKPLIASQSYSMPFWNAFDFVLLLGVLLVATNLLSTLFDVAGWNPQSEESEDAPVTMSVPQLAMSSMGTLLAMLGTVGLLRLRSSSVLSQLGLIPSKSMLVLGLRGAVLILPPTMILMALVSLLQEYSHPVLEALQTEGEGDPGKWGVFGMLFVTTAIIAPVFEEFWFRALLQGGLQRLADGSKPPSASNAPRVGSLDQQDPQGSTTDEPSDSFTDGDSPAEPSSAAVVWQPNSPGTELDESAPAIAWQPVAIWPMVVASMVFSAMHLGQGLAPIPLFFLSLAMGYLYRQTGSLVPSIIVHMILNGLTMTVTLLEILRGVG
ncbi:MAG: type II CAAX endopeptidase family protein [Planctomycetota bacterium]